MKKILVIEDEKILAEMYKDKLSKEGFKIVEAMEAEEGLQLAEEERPDLIVLDILLPRENGITFLKKMRRIPEISSIPVVVLSNFDDPYTKKQALNLGAKEYLIKSNHDPKDTVERIKKYIR